jgi:hypothetical protein
MFLSAIFRMLPLVFLCSSVFCIVGMRV